MTPAGYQGGKRKLNPSRPPKLKRNKSKAPWAFPLAEILLSVRLRRTCRDSPVPSPPVLATVTASQALSRAQHAQDLQGLSRAQPAPAGHRHSQSAPLPFFPGRARSSVRDGPELRHACTDVVNLYIRFRPGSVLKIERTKHRCSLRLL